MSFCLLYFVFPVWDEGSLLAVLSALSHVVPGAETVDFPHAKYKLHSIKLFLWSLISLFDNIMVIVITYLQHTYAAWKNQIWTKNELHCLAEEVIGNSGKYHIVMWSWGSYKVVTASGRLKRNTILMTARYCLSSNWS